MTQRSCAAPHTPAGRDNRRNLASCRYRSGRKSLVTHPGRADDVDVQGHLIVGDDGSRVAAAAVDWAVDEATRRGAGVTIVGCFEIPTMTDDGIPSPRVSKTEMEACREAVQRRLDDVANEIASNRPGLAVNACAVYGRARRELVEQASHADLLVIGSSGTGDSAVYLLGSVAHALIRNSPCPVVLVPGNRALPAVPHVVVATDGMTRCEDAIDWACDEADLLGGRLTVVHVWSYPYGEATVHSEARDLTRVDAALHLEQAVEKARARSGADIESLLIEGDARADVAARAFSADLVVLGTHHRRAFGLVPIGSVTDAVIAHATCPIVMVRERTTD